MATKKLERSEATRDRILKVALATFSEHGFDGATTRQIAARSGVNHGLIPYYFGSKEKLWRAAVDAAFAEMGSDIGGILADPAIPSERDRAARLIHSHVRFVARNPEFVRLMHEEGKRRGPRMRWMVDRHVEPMYRTIVSLLERLTASGGQWADIEPVHFFYILAGAVGVIFHQAEECKRVSGVDPFDEAVVDAHTRAVTLLLLGPDTAPTNPDKEKTS